MKFFEHELPINPSSMTRWRKPIGEAGAEELLKETIEADLELKAVKSFQLKRAADFLRQIFLWFQFCQRTSFSGSTIAA
jgi:hypothetical protein